MTVRPPSACEFGVLGCLVASLFACGSTNTHGTKTDNVAMQHGLPKPDGGEPSSPGDTGAGANERSPRGCSPFQRDDGKPRQVALWGRAGSLLIGASPDHGLIAVDTSDTTNPKLQSETPLHGEPGQLIVDADAQVAVAIDEVPVGAQDSVLATKLVRFDASDPRAVKRSGDMPIEGEFWSMRVRGSTVWVMSARVADSVTSGPSDCGVVERTALIVVGYQWSGGAWKRVARSELASSGPAWELSDGYAAYEERFDDQDTLQSATLRFVRFDGDDALGQPDMVALPGQVMQDTPIGLSDSVVRGFFHTDQDGNSELETIALASGKVLSKVDDLPQPYGATFFSGERVFVDGESDGSAVRLVDFSDERAPTSQSFPDGVTSVVPIGDGTQLLGWSEPRAHPPGTPQPMPNVIGSLFALQNGSPVQLAQVTVNQGIGEIIDIDHVHVLGDHVIVGYGLSGGRNVSVVLAVSAAKLERVGEIDAGDADEIFASGTTFFAPATDALYTGSFDGGDAHVLAWAQ